MQLNWALTFGHNNPYLWPYNMAWATYSMVSLECKRNKRQKQPFVKCSLENWNSCHHLMKQMHKLIRKERKNEGENTEKYCNLFELRCLLTSNMRFSQKPNRYRLIIDPQQVSRLKKDKSVELNYTLKSKLTESGQWT